MNGMKKQAQIGQWKTPPNLVYAQQQQQQHQQNASSGTSSSSLGTKMKLLGLQQKRPSINMSDVSMETALPPPPLSPIYSDAATNSLFRPIVHNNNNNGDHLPPPPPPLSNDIEMKAVEQAPSKKSSSTTRKTPKKVAAAAAAAAASSVLDSPKNPSSLTRSSSSNASPSPAAAVTPIDKQKMLEHSRTMARLRRQQQRVLTDSLESEFFELCVSAAYLKAALQATPSNKPLQRSQIDQIFQQATERSLEAMSSNIPTARSQELKNSNLEKVNMPQSHFIPSLRLDEATAIHLAVTVGSRRESLSFSTQRRRVALQWAKEGVKDLYNDLASDALPAVLLGNAVLDNNDSTSHLASRLNLSPEQKRKIAQTLVPEVQANLCQILTSQRASELMLSDGWLSLPKTEAFMEQFRDTITGEQMGKLISWSIQNEAQISTLKLGSTPSSNPVSPNTNGM